MKSVKLQIIIIILLGLFISCSDSVTDTQENIEITEVIKKVSEAADKFGLNLFREANVYEGEKNVFISPLSVSVALGMALNGADNLTYDEMKNTLELNGLSETEVNESYQTLINVLTQIDPKVIFNIANSIWYKNTFSVNQNFLDVNKKYFNAEVEALDFNNSNSVDIINNWVDLSTNGKITNILSEIPPAAIMYLINAIYFKGDWKFQFDESRTNKNDFYLADGSAIQCDIMNQLNDFMYYENNSFQMIDLPYGDDKFSMTVILPAQDKSVDEIINQLTVENLSVWLGNLSEQEVNFSLPKFKLEYEILLNNVLKQLGMELAFTDNADFTKINSNGGIFISKVKHKAFVDVNEEGTEAAAVTIIEIEVTSIPQQTIMYVNRPFIFMIRENTTGNISFIGKIINPIAQ